MEKYKAICNFNCHCVGSGRIGSFVDTKKHGAVQLTPPPCACSAVLLISYCMDGLIHTYGNRQRSGLSGQAKESLRGKQRTSGLLSTAYDKFLLEHNIFQPDGIFTGIFLAAFTVGAYCSNDIQVFKSK